LLPPTAPFEAVLAPARNLRRVECRVKLNPADAGEHAMAIGLRIATTM
jgi:hypothetical protein